MPRTDRKRMLTTIGTQATAGTPEGLETAATADIL
jgi:hypothetical protein